MNIKKTLSRLLRKEHVPSKKLRVLIPTLLIVVWILVGGIGGQYFGKIEEVSSTDLATFLPESADATKVNERLSEFRDSSTIPSIAVFESQEDLSDEQKRALASLQETLTDSPVSAADVSPPLYAEDGRAAFIVVPLESGADFPEVLPELRSTIDEAATGLDYKLTGPASFASDLNKAFAGIDGLLLAVALSVVFIILLAVYRSPLLPVLVLLVSLFSLSASIFVVWNLANAGFVELNGQVQGILFILVIGAATDYSLLLVSRYREELIRHKHSFTALRVALKSSLEPIAASGGTVIAGLMCLLLSDLGSNNALGPVGALGILFAMLGALTFLPALLAPFGRKVFWPRSPQYSLATKIIQSPPRHKFWERVSLFVRNYPRPIWITTTAVLLVASLGLVQLRADGVEQGDLILGYSEAREGQAMLSRHFPDGSGTPTYVITDESQLSNITEVLDNDQGVEGVSVAANDSASGEKPLGNAEAAIKQEIRGGVEQQLTQQRTAIEQRINEELRAAPPAARQAAIDQAVAAIPSVAELVDRAYPFADAEPRVSNGDVLINVTLSDESDSASAKATVERLREKLASADTSALVGGVTAVQIDTNAASIRDRTIILPAILLAITLILMLLLRSIVAPILLLATTVLSFGATMGISAFLFNNVWGFPGADPSVVLYGFVFLVALGIDYNIFLMTRVREEALKHGTKQGVLKGLVATGGVITSAGVVLAATFAALAVIPILFLAQLAFIVAFGVLLDTIIVRSLLVPALILDIGPKVWWPAKLK